MLVVFLVLAAQFESFVHPFVIMLTVPLAVLGALLGILAGASWRRCLPASAPRSTSTARSAS
jgi:Cu/Ag efflux pump CusA